MNDGGGGGMKSDASARSMFGSPNGNMELNHSMQTIALETSLGEVSPIALFVYCLFVFVLYHI